MPGLPTQDWSWGRGLLWAEVRHHLILPGSEAKQRWCRSFWIRTPWRPRPWFSTFFRAGASWNYIDDSYGQRSWDFLRPYSIIWKHLAFPDIYECRSHVPFKHGLKIGLEVPKCQISHGSAQSLKQTGVKSSFLLKFGRTVTPAMPVGF